MKLKSNSNLKIIDKIKDKKIKEIHIKNSSLNPLSSKNSFLSSTNNICFTSNNNTNTTYGHRTKISSFNYLSTSPVIAKPNATNSKLTFSMKTNAFTYKRKNLKIDTTAVKSSDFNNLNTLTNSKNQLTNIKGHQKVFSLESMPSLSKVNSIRANKAQGSRLDKNISSINNISQIKKETKFTSKFIKDFFLKAYDNTSNNIIFANSGKFTFPLITLLSNN